MIKDIVAIRLYERLGRLRTGRTAHGYGDGQSIDASATWHPRLTLLTVFRKQRMREIAEVSRARRALMRCVAEQHTAEEA